MRLPTKSPATDESGRRYGSYFWMTLSLGHVHLSIFPKHTRRIWTSFDWRNPDWKSKQEVIELKKPSLQFMTEEEAQALFGV
jgi:hypothetical protein